MFTYAILLWVLLDLSAPTWCYVLLAMAVAANIFKWGMDLINPNLSDQ